MWYVRQESLRSACAYAQSDQSLCKSLEYSMTVKLPTEHHLGFLSLKEGCIGSSESTLVKMHIVRNHMSRLKCFSTYCFLYKPDGEGPCQPKVNAQADRRLRCVSRFLCCVKIIRIN